MLEILKAVLFGIVEGITEWLPISSTGHLILLNKFVTLNVSESFWSMFEVVIQLGAILAVVVIFWKKIWPFSAKAKETHYVKMDIMQMWFKIIVACLPAAIVGVLFDKQIEALFYRPIVIALALIIFGIGFIIVEAKHKNLSPKITSVKEITYNTALIIGAFQLIAALFPGTSRSGATILGAIMIGVSRSVAAEFTFYLAIPVMFGASLLKLVKFGFVFTGSELTILLVGMVVSFLVSIIVIKFLMDYIKKHDFTIFGWYRIALGIMVIAYFALFGGLFAA